MNIIYIKSILTFQFFFSSLLIKIVSTTSPNSSTDFKRVEILTIAGFVRAYLPGTPNVLYVLVDGVSGIENELVQTEVHEKLIEESLTGVDTAVIYVFPLDLNNQRIAFTEKVDAYYTLKFKENIIALHSRSG